MTPGHLRGHRHNESSSADRTPAALGCFPAGPGRHGFGYHARVDVLILIVVLGCALAGGFWGVVRLSAWVVAMAAAVGAGRWAGPPAARLLAGGDVPSTWVTAAGVALAAGAAVGLVLVAGRGVRQALAKSRLGCVDRIAGALAASGTALALSAVLLALAGESGFHPTSPWSQRLQQLGRDLLVLHQDQAEQSPRL